MANILPETEVEGSMISTCLLHGFICNNKLHFTSLYTMTMLFVRSWIVHLTPIPCLPKSSQVSTLCGVSGFLLVKLVTLLNTWKCGL